MRVCSHRPSLLTSSKNMTSGSGVGVKGRGAGEMYAHGLRRLARAAATVARSGRSAPLEVNAHHHPLGLTAVMHRVCASPSALSRMNGARRGMA